MSQVIVDGIRKRLLQQNQNFLAVFAGACGSGKSYAAMRLCSLVDPKFDMSRVVFTAEEFLALVNSDLPAGSAIMWDESGVNLDARSFMSVMNKVTSYVLQTFRHKNYFVVFTVPSMSFLDNRARTLTNALVIMKSIDRKKHKSRAKFYFVDCNARTGKVYTVLPRVKGPRGVTVLTHLNFSMPPKKLRDAYEKKKQAFTKKLNKECHADIVALQAPKEKARDMGSIIEEAKKSLPDITNDKGKLSYSLIQVKFGCGVDKAKSIRKALAEMGVSNS